MTKKTPVEETWQAPTVPVDKQREELAKTSADRSVQVSNPATGRKTNFQPHIEEEKTLDPEFQEMLFGLRQVWIEKNNRKISR